MVRAALMQPSPINTSQQRVMFFEPELPTGFPDIVAVYPSKRKTQISEGRANISPQHLRLLHVLYSIKKTKLDSIGASLLWSDREVHKIVDELVVAEMVRVRGAFVYSKKLDDIFVAEQIVAIEAKIGNWKRAIEQACANKWFASQSYILVPSRRDLSLVVESAVANGIGILTFDGTYLRTIVEPKEHAIPASYGSWLFNEWTLHKMSGSRCND